MITFYSKCMQTQMMLLLLQSSRMQIADIQVTAVSCELGGVSGGCEVEHYECLRLCPDG